MLTQNSPNVGNPEKCPHQVQLFVLLAEIQTEQLTLKVSKQGEFCV